MSNNNGSKNMIIGALLVIALGLGGYVLYQQSQEPDLSISVSEDGIDISGN